MFHTLTTRIAKLAAITILTVALAAGVATTPAEAMNPAQTTGTGVINLLGGTSGPAPATGPAPTGRRGPSTATSSTPRPPATRRSP